MEISTVYTCQDTEYECETESQQCDHAEETEQWLSEDFHRQRCEVRARRGAKIVLQNSDCFRTKSMENVECCATGVAKGH